ASFGPPAPVAMETDVRSKETPGLIHLLIVFRPHANVQMKAPLVNPFLAHNLPSICAIRTPSAYT
ncbi:hypothetical protein GOODEAATRI_018125, partial [Goodea atripinnis]